MTRNKQGASIFTLLAALLAVFLMAAPALATHGKGNAKHKASSDRGGDTYSEDNDTNDGGTANNVEDDGDNRHPSGKDRSVEKGKSGNQGNGTSDPDDDGRGPDRSNGGPDKPNGSGGEDLADQDGNNGCGNDDDFEDDNEGWCGKPQDEEVDVQGAEDGKVTICHATGSATNPWVTITVDANGLNGHDDHEGDIVNPMGECGVEVAGSETVPCEDAMVEADAEACEAALGTDEALPGDMVLGSHLSQPGDATGEEGPSVLGASAEAGEEGGALPFTGGAILPFLFVAGALIAAGMLLFRRNRTQDI